MRVLVTGGAGFVGSNLVAHLLEQGHDPVVLDDLSAGARPEWWKRRGGPKCVEGSVEDPAAARTAVRGVQGVVHLAAKPGVADSVAHPEIDFRVNVAGTFSVLDAARKAGTERFVFASSGAVLAGAGPPLREDMAPAPLSPPPDPGQDPRHTDSIDPQWNLFDFTPEGRGEKWNPKLSY